VHWAESRDLMVLELAGHTTAFVTFVDFDEWHGQ
jgi:hypothetical protein